MYGVCCPVNISTGHIEFSRLRKTESVTLGTVSCREKNKSLETGTPPALCVWHSEPHPVKRTEKKYKVFPAGSHVLLAAFYTVTKGTKLSENRTVIKKLSFAPQGYAALSLTIAAQFLHYRGRPLWLQRCDFRTAENPFLLTTAAQNMRVLLRKLPLC